MTPSAAQVPLPDRRPSWGRTYQARLQVADSSGLLLSASSGLLYVAAFPGVGLWPVALVALIPLLLALRGCPPRAALLRGWMAGLVSAVAGFSWLAPTLQRFAGWSGPKSALALLAFAAFQGGRMGLAGWLAARAERRGWPRRPTFALAFVTSELLYPVLFPWYLGAALHEWTLVVQLVDVTGPLGLTALVVACNLALSEPIEAVREGRPPRWSSVALWTGALAVALAYGGARRPKIARMMAGAPAATVGIVQANTSALDKRDSPQEALRAHLALTPPAGAGPDFLVWGETALSKAERFDRPSLEQQMLLARVGRPMVFGAVVSSPGEGSAGERLHNSVLSSDATGALTGRYDKHHLVPFAEFIPFERRLPGLRRLLPDAGAFSAGAGPGTVTVLGHRVGALLCYEDLLPAFVNELVRTKHPELLVNLANDAWFGDSAALPLHFALARLRAVEHRRFLVRANNSGISAIVDPLGQVVARARPFTSALVLSEVRWMGGRTPYERWGNVPFWAGALVSMALAFLRRRR